MFYIEDAMIWDGSHLGTYDETVILNKIKLYPCNIYSIYIKEYMKTPEWYAMHKSNDKYSCIIDEIKPIMGLTKIGTHSINIGSSLYTIYRTNGYPTLLKGLTIKTILNSFSSVRLISSSVYKMMVQDTFVFRMIVGLTSNCESSIMLVDGIPSSYRNKMDTKKDDSPNMSPSVMDKWFVDSVEDSIKRFVAHSVHTLTMRQSIQKVVKRLDPNLIWVENFILDRMLRIC